MVFARSPLAVAVLAALALTACGDDDGDGAADEPASPTSARPADTEPAPASSVAATSGPTPTSAPSGERPATAADLDGREWIATAAEGHELVAGSQVYVDFGDGRIGASGGCNLLSAETWSIEDGQLVVDGIAGTEMACDPPALMDQDAWLAALLTGRPQVTVAEETMTITAGDVTLTLTDREAADPDRPLEGTAWELESLLSADTASSVPAGVRVPTLSIEGGQMSVDLGCNTGRGPVTVGDGTLEIGPLATTLMLCEGDAGAVETHLLGVLDGTVSYTIDADVLTVMNGADGAAYHAAD